MTSTARDQQIARVRQYFAMWLKRDFAELPTIMATDCYYQECYGPVYLSLAEVQAWVAHQLTVQTVTAWPINQVWLASESTVFVSWSFTATTNTTTHFDGISQIHFNAANQIDELREYETKAEHVYPYHHE